jgi:hypothetical protein
MPFVHDLLDRLHLPPLPADRSGIIRTLLEQEYGVIPAIPCRVEGRVTRTEQDFCAGKAPLQRVEITLHLPAGSFSFPATYVRPAAPGVHPLLVFLNFTHDVPDKYYPAEEICDRGYAVLCAGYEDISKDAQDDYSSGLGKLLRDAAAQGGVPREQLPGKIAIWAWAASRMLDWALTQPGVTAERTAVIGHSRLGKTALVSGMLDERYACVISNASGCSGAAITRGKSGEHISDITGRFPYWFCENYRQYAGNEAAMPFDQHWLLAALAPRLVCVSSGAQDTWAGPGHEFLSCAAASAAWEKQGVPGFMTPDRLPLPGEALQQGSIGYHMRPGCHYHSREDWNRFLDFLDAKGWRE